MLDNISVIIYQPTQSASQSGFKKYNHWKIKFPTDESKYTYNFIGWTGSKDTKQQLNLKFSTKEEAINFAQAKHWKYQVILPKKRKIVAKSYASNFVN